MATLADFIKRGGDKPKLIFEDEFQTPEGWRSYLEKAFKPWSNQPVTRLLNGGDLTIDAFQALYIACWVSLPVEKGSYMIELDDSQHKRVEVGYNGLKKRWSSHLQGGGRTAAEGWKFLKGYQELLVLMVDIGTHDGNPSSLFLKGEGNSSISIPHLIAYVKKSFTGKGNTANKALHQLAKDRTVDGMRERAAENYSKKYEKVLAVLGLKGQTQTVRDVAVAMRSKLVALEKEDRLNDLGRRNGIKSDPDLTNPATLADVLDKVLLPVALELRDTNNLKRAVMKAKPDFDTIIVDLRGDKGASERFFEEVKLLPSDLDDALVKFYNALNRASTTRQKAYTI
jgi:hypothetical protein